MVKPYSFFAALLLVYACGRSKTTRPAEHYLQMNPAPPASRLQVPVEVSERALAELVNAQFPEQLLYDPDFMGRGLELSVARAGDVSLGFRQNRLFTRIPLRLRIDKDAFLAKLNARGTLEVELATELGVGADWRLDSETELTDYEWTVTPRLGVGGLSIPVERLTAGVIERLRERVGQEVDKAIGERVNLRGLVEAGWTQLAQPRALDEADTAYLAVHPVALSLGELRSTETGVATLVQLDLRPEVVLGPAPRDTLAGPPLPQNDPIRTELDGFGLELHTQLPFDELRRVLAKAVVDTVIERGGRSATVEEVTVYGQDCRLVIGLRLTGEYTGWAYLLTRPVFDADAERVELTDVDLKLATRSALAKTVGWLLRGRIKRALNRKVGEKSHDALLAARQKLNDGLSGRALAPGVRARGRADKLTVDEIVLSPAGLGVTLSFRGNLRVQVDRIPLPPRPAAATGRERKG